MLIRIVKLTFESEETDFFLKTFKKKKQYIRGFEGCSHLELYRDQDHRNIFFTYSFWKDDAALQTYRKSALFKEIWSTIKPKFSARAQAWSVDKIVSLP